MFFLRVSTVVLLLIGITERALTEPWSEKLQNYNLAKAAANKYAKNIKKWKENEYSVNVWKEEGEFIYVELNNNKDYIKKYDNSSTFTGGLSFIVIFNRSKNKIINTIHFQ